MNPPRRHHYVPQYHQRRFAKKDGRFWVWDKLDDRVFESAPDAMAVQADFYRLHEFEELGHDPFTMEKQLSYMEGQMSLITGSWLDQLRIMNLGERLAIPKRIRRLVARYMAVQFLRTADVRDFLNAIHATDHVTEALSRKAQTDLHTKLLWDLPIANAIKNHIRHAIWIFARNSTSTPFMTSDNPICFRSKDNAQWMKAGFLGAGTCVVYPLAPDIVMFCHERRYWRRIARLDRRLSPILLSADMVQSENSGQVFMAKRFVISPTSDFADARECAKTIGTDKYARPVQDNC